MKRFIHTGDVLTLTAPADLTSGQAFHVGAIIAVATADALTGASVEAITTGVIEHEKTSDEAWTVGALIYWDDTAGEFTTTSTDNTLAGVAVAAAADPSATGRVRLNGSFA
jgi:predicted RecA/RadA family phage recombinase